MNNALIAIAGLLTITSCLPYIIDIAKNKTHPNLVSWITWMLVSGINTAAALSDHAIHTAILSGSIVLTDLIIIIMGLKRGVRRYTKFDIICQIIAIIGLVLWLATGNASLAVVSSISVVFIAALPTWRHAYLKPSEETWQGFAMAVIASVLTILSITNYTFVSLAFPVVTVINCSVIVAIILLGRKNEGLHKLLDLSKR